jgi:hypothetical protein
MLGLHFYKFNMYRQNINIQTKCSSYTGKALFNHDSFSPSQSHKKVPWKVVGTIYRSNLTVVMFKSQKFLFCSANYEKSLIKRCLVWYTLRQEVRRGCGCHERANCCRYKLTLHTTLFNFSAIISYIILFFCSAVLSFSILKWVYSIILLQSEHD